MPAAAAAQLADLQPGRNYVAAANFGLNDSEGIDLGDCDNDGDLDAIVGNGGDFGPQPNRIFINQGGLQAGSIGTYAEETAARFAGFALDRTRDIEFADIEDDGDLDALSGNDGGTTMGGISRFYVNLGGVQGGSVGYFADGTDRSWGLLVSVPLAQQLLGNGTGPFLEHTCDCDFADLDDDGSLDLFHSSYGPGINGTQDSRIFLNDGTGIFDELWPWADPAADTKMHALDVDLADFDGDLDIDVFVTSRNTQSRAFRSNLHDDAATSPFTDVTATALTGSGAGQLGVATYQADFADVDGDGDFDLWVDNYNNNSERLLANDGPLPGGGFSFTSQLAWIKNDGNLDEENILFTDYDGDGDLDAFLANFSGTQQTYQSALAQDYDPDTQGVFHRNGATTGQAPHVEIPTGTAGGLTSLYARTGDVDDDGDEDVAIVNASNQQNYLYRNALGVPDVHAPTIHLLEDVPDQPAGAAVPVHAQVRDNTDSDVARWHAATLFSSVNGGAQSGVPMRWQGSFQYRGVIPSGDDGLISYRVEVTDGAGNTGASVTGSFLRGATTPWTGLGFALPGAGGAPVLSGSGPLVAGSPGALTLAGAAPLAPSLLFLSLGSSPAAFKGGTLAAFPPIILLPLSTDAAGAIPLPWPAWPPAIAPGTVLVFQYAVQDTGAVHGLALSNALQALTP